MLVHKRSLLTQVAPSLASEAILPENSVKSNIRSIRFVGPTTPFDQRLQEIHVPEYTAKGSENTPTTSPVTTKVPAPTPTDPPQNK